jgi:hypothetical protein
MERLKTAVIGNGLHLVSDVWLTRRSISCGTSSKPFGDNCEEIFVVGRSWVLLFAVFYLTLFSMLLEAEVQCPIEGDTGELINSNGSWGKVSSIVREDFETGVLDENYPSGFRWGQTWQSVRMSVVRDDQYIVWKNGRVMEGPVSGADWEGFSGMHSLRFAYPAGQNGWSEQRFSLGGAYPELWIGYWLRVPSNWEHGTGRDSNNKFFAIWMDEYEREGPTGVIQTRNRSGNSIISPYVRTRANRHLGESPGMTLIEVPKDRGRWMQVIIWVKMASSATAADGNFAMYRRWEGEDEFENVFSYNDWDNYHVGGNRGFAHGYLMGWANAIQPRTSDWLLDDFIVSQENLLEAASSASSLASPPDPQHLVPHIILP